MYIAKIGVWKLLYLEKVQRVFDETVLVLITIYYFSISGAICS